MNHQKKYWKGSRKQLRNSELCSLATTCTRLTYRITLVHALLKRLWLRAMHMQCKREPMPFFGHPSRYPLGGMCRKISGPSILNRAGPCRRSNGHPYWVGINIRPPPPPPPPPPMDWDKHSHPNDCAGLSNRTLSPKLMGLVVLQPN